MIWSQRGAGVRVEEMMVWSQRRHMHGMRRKSDGINVETYT
jgi:hypothetical protein